MPKLTEAELARKDTIDAIRTAARLQMRIAMRRLLNEVETEVLAEFDKRLAAGKPYKLDMRSVLALVQERIDDRA